MRRLQSGHLREFVAFMLAVSVSVCCCQAHFVLHGFDGSAEAGGEPRGKGEPSGDAAAGQPSGAACCTNCSDDAPGERPAAPDKSCQSCCVKGTGLKDGVSVPAPDVSDLLACCAEAPSYASVPEVSVPLRRTSKTPFVAPPTLLRLRCALII